MSSLSSNIHVPSKRVVTVLNHSRFLSLPTHLRSFHFSNYSTIHKCLHPPAGTSRHPPCSHVSFMPLISSLRAIHEHLTALNCASSRRNLFSSLLPVPIQIAPPHSNSLPYLLFHPRGFAPLLLFPGSLRVFIALMFRLYLDTSTDHPLKFVVSSAQMFLVFPQHVRK